MLICFSGCHAIIVPSFEEVKTMTQNEYDLINLRGKYALDPEEMFEAISVMIPSYGEEAVRKIARAWSRKAENTGRQLKLF